ncbi:MAG: ABC transporter substrate-binding protein [Actinomycetota bacterium]|nr:ABC transporter substrate-binding protein [Actinomycetota bacterium]
MRLVQRRSRQLTICAAVSSALVALAACAPSSSLSGDPTSPSQSEIASSDAPAAADAIELKVGVLAPMTGFVSAIGTDLKQGWDLFWDENGTTVGAFEVTTVLEDDASSPETALSKAQRLVTEEKVDVVLGPVLANQALAVADYLARQEVPNLSMSSADDVTQRDFSPFVLRTGAMAGSQMTFPGGQWAFEEGYRTAATLCVDYAFGWESCGGFVSAFADAGGEVTQQRWYPGDASDLSTYVAQLLNADVDVIFAGTAGGTDSSNFLRSAADFGLLDKTPVLTNCCTLDQAIIQDVGDISLGVKSVSFYTEGADRVSGFVEKFEERYGVIPSLYAIGAYVSGQMLVAALEDLDAKPSGDELIAAMKSADLSNSLWGDVSFDDYNNLVGPVAIREVVAREDGTLWNVVIDEIPDVSQFWTFDADEFLSSPPFSTTRTGQ